MNFWVRAEAFPPILCRLLARHKHGRPLSALEISEGSMTAVSPAEVSVISQCCQWGSVQVLPMSWFLRGCQIDFCNPGHMRRVDAYLRSNPTFNHLHNSPEWESLYKPMLIRWRKSYGAVTHRDTYIWKPVLNLLIRLNPLLHQ